MRVKNAKQRALLNVREALDLLIELGGNDMGHFTLTEAAWFHANVEGLEKWLDIVEQYAFRDDALTDAQYERAAEDAERVANAREDWQP